MSKFQKGQRKPDGSGRKKGVQNQATKSMRLQIESLLVDLYPQVLEDVLLLEPKDRISTFIKLLEYSLPKKREQKIDVSALNDDEINELISRITENG